MTPVGVDAAGAGAAVAALPCWRSERPGDAAMGVVVLSRKEGERETDTETESKTERQRDRESETQRDGHKETGRAIER